MMWHWRFWAGVAELAIATTCESVAALLSVAGAGAVLGLGILEVDWRGVLSVAGLAGVIAAAKAIAAAYVGKRGTWTFVSPPGRNDDADPRHDQPSRPA